MDNINEKKVKLFIEIYNNYKNEKLDTDADKPFKSDSEKALLGNHELPDMRKK